MAEIDRVQGRKEGNRITTEKSRYCAEMRRALGVCHVRAFSWTYQDTTAVL